MKTEIRLSNESAKIIKFKHCLKILAKGIYAIFRPILWAFKKVGLGLLHFWYTVYEIIYSKRKVIGRIYFRALLVTEIIWGSIYMIQYIFNHIKEDYLLWLMGGSIGGSLLVLLIFYLYHLVFGRDMLHQQYAILTQLYAETELPHNIKYCGPRRVGKDTIMTSFTSLIIYIFKKKIQKKMKRIIKICYIFDFEKVNLACEANAKYFYQPSEDNRREAFIKLCKNIDIKAFLTEKALKKINYKRLVSEYEYSLKDKLNFKTKYMFSDGANKIHFLGLLNEYMFLYVRLYIVKNFVFSNQPYVEDPETGVMAKIYSVYYEAISSKKDEYRTEKLPDGSSETVVYEEIVEAPIINYSIIIKTEEDSWSSNVNPKVKKQIEDYSLRDEKAFLFHRYEEIYIFQVCQDPLRTNKQLRELDAFYLTVIHREEIVGAPKRNAVLLVIQKMVDRYVERKQYNYDLSNRKGFYKQRKKIAYLEKLYQSTMDGKYLEKIEKICQKEHKPPGRLFYKLAEINKRLLEKMALNNMKYGLIKLTATISDQPVASNLKEGNLRALIKKHKPLFHESYLIDFYFPKTYSMGRYNTHFMSNVFENRAKQSKTTIMDVPNWDKTMELSRDVMLHMGYPAGHKMYGITDEEVFEARYKRKENK